MAKQQPNPEAGVRQPDKPGRPVENFEEDLAAVTGGRRNRPTRKIARLPMR